MPIWSKSTSEWADLSDAGEEAALPDTEDAAAADFLLPWLERLGPCAGPDTLLHYVPSAANSIDLTHAHPSGLAQLLAGRRTRLSTLLRDPAQLASAMHAARKLRAKIHELSTERGLDVGFLAAGTASWRHVDDAGRSELLNAPVLLTQVSLTLHGTQDDYELQLTGQARLNAGLVRHLNDLHGLDLDEVALAGLAYSTARFDPHPVLDRLRTLTAAVRGMAIEHHILVSTFADVPDITADPAVSPERPVLAALIQAAFDVGTTSAPPPAAIPAAGQALTKPLDERHPAEEHLVLDADGPQQEVLDAVAEGGSLVVSAPPGTGQTQTAVNAAAALAGAGKSILVVAERRSTLAAFAARCDALGLGSLVLPLQGAPGPGMLKDQLTRAIVRSEKAVEPRLEGLHRTLLAHRHQLLDHVRSLHSVRPRWGCSPYQAMQSLAGLMALDPAPATTVRLKRSVLDSIRDRVELAARLGRAAELGSFSKAAARSPWYGARLVNRSETERAQGLAVDLAKDIPELREQVQRVADHSQIRLGGSFREWGEQLDLLVAVRASLDKFTPDVFDRPVTDLISATASSAWRREHSIEMSSMTRSRLRRVAKEYVRPGVHISDLHEGLVQVQEQQTLWSRYATTERHPSVPTGLAELNNFFHAVARRVAELGNVLPSTPDEPALGERPLEELQEFLGRLAQDGETLETLPERTLLIEEMRDHGLGDLLDDLAQREVGPGQVADELELAWWQSALEAMISGDDYLAMSDGESLRRLEAEYRLADTAHIESGAGRLRWNLAERWRDGVAARPAEAEQLKELLRAGSADLDDYVAGADGLVSILSPAWTSSPLLVAKMIPAGKTFDAVILLDAESMSLQSAVPALARGRQVIAFGDQNAGEPRNFSVRVDTEPQGAAALPSAYEALAEIFPQFRLSTVYRTPDKSLTDLLNGRFYGGRLLCLPRAAALSRGRGLRVEYLPDGTGMPSSDHEGVESVAAEVNRVVDLVFEHIRRRPGSSLAVVTASARHAARVAEAVRLQLADNPWASGFFKSAREPFRVVPVDRAAGTVRDSIIFSLGFGRTPHGRALHNFGMLSQPGGRAWFVTAMTRARHQLHILTCFRPEDLNPERLDHGAQDFHALLEREIGAGQAAVDTAVAGAQSTDALVADLVSRLRDRGAEVREPEDAVLDIAATAPAASGQDGAGDGFDCPPVAIVSDGTAHYRAMSVRERSRLRPQLLERMGWRYMALWTIEVFTDPGECADHIAGYLGLSGEHPWISAAGAGRAGPGDGSPQGVRPEDSGMKDSERLQGQIKGPAAHDAVPVRAAEDDPRSWGEAEEDRDSWLREQRPPHWG
jgi:hypothetical protein